MILLISGYPYSGKSTFASFLGGGRELSAALPGPDKLTQGESLRREFPRWILASASYSPEVSLYVGIRSPEEVEFFRHREESFLVFLVSSLRTRAQRLAQAKGVSLEKALDLLRRRDAREEGLGLKEVKEMANAYVLNEGSLEDLRERARFLAERLGWTSKPPRK